MSDPNFGGPSPEEMGIHSEETKTPEQIERERAEKLAEFRQISEPMLDQFYQEGKTPFGIPREEAMDKVSERIFKRVEETELNVDIGYLGRVTEVVDAINKVTGQNLALGKVPLQVIEYHLQAAAGVEPEIDLKSVAYMAGDMDKGFKKATGVSLAGWAAEYQKVHPNEIRDQKSNEALITIFEKDFDKHTLNQSNLTRIFVEYLSNENVDDLNASVAIGLLSERGFLVPSEWKEEYSENGDGRTVLDAIEGAKRKLQSEEILTTLQATFADLSPEELRANIVTVSDVLAVASLDSEIPGSWNECDDNTRKMINGVMSEIAKSFGKKVGKSKGEPVVKFS